MEIGELFMTRDGPLVGTGTRREREVKKKLKKKKKEKKDATEGWPGEEGKEECARNKDEDELERK